MQNQKINFQGAIMSEINLTSIQRKAYASMRDSYCFKKMDWDNVIMRSAIQNPISCIMTYDTEPDIMINIHGKITILD